MKKIVLNLNRGWYVVLSMMCVFVIAAINFVACHNESDPIPADEGIEYLIPENARVFVGFAWIMKSAENDKILTTSDGNIAVALSASARPFYLPKDIRHYQEG